MLVKMQNNDLHSNLKNHISTNYTATNLKINSKNSKPLFLDRYMPISLIKTIDVSIDLVKFNYGSASFSPYRYCLEKIMKNGVFINQKVVYKLISVPHTHF